jgi:hypothetical protein
MSNPLFSTYSQGENRVTASMLAVFERISFSIVQQILQILLEETETEFLTFRNQIVGPSSVPDARIGASFAIWIETKIDTNSIRIDQLRGHLKALDAEKNVADQRLLVLSPDSLKPKEIDSIQDDRLGWANFSMLYDAIRQILDPENDLLYSNFSVPTERERELLRELIQFLASEGLVGRGDGQVLVVPARRALAEYKRFSAYICQPNRSFRPSSHLAFYRNGKIDRLVPEISSTIESIFMSREGFQDKNLSNEQREKFVELIEKMEQENNHNLGEEHKIIFLSAPEDSLTIDIGHEIVNDLESESGRGVAFTQGQRYVSLEAIQKKPKTTSELLEFDLID